MIFLKYHKDLLINIINTNKQTFNKYLIYKLKYLHLKKLQNERKTILKNLLFTPLKILY